MLPSRKMYSSVWSKIISYIRFEMSIKWSLIVCVLFTSIKGYG